jgi:two-component system, chemotaxis family, chemotaxis protein CheY
MAKIDMSSLKVLVIDDEDFMRKLIGRVLHDIGVREIVLAENGAQGLGSVQALGAQIDVIICDLEMPTMNGTEFVRNLRKLPDQQMSRIPVVILTGHSDEDHIIGVVEQGINGYLVKPVAKKALEARLSNAIMGPMIDPSKLKRKT